MATKPAFLIFDWLFCTTFHLGMNNRTYQVLLCLQSTCLLSFHLHAGTRVLS